MLPKIGECCPSFPTNCGKTLLKEGVATMPKARMILVAAAPVLLLIILSLTSRLLPLVLGDTEDSGRDRRPDGSDRRIGERRRRPPRPVDAKTQKAIETAVSGQLTAIRKRDFTTALE